MRKRSTDRYIGDKCRVVIRSIKQKWSTILSNSIHALLFDLGGVIFEVDFNRAFSRWAAHSGERSDSIKERFTFDSFYERHERGEIDASEYFASLRTSLGIDISDVAFVEGWNDIYVREIPGMMELLQRASTNVPLYAFTNSNATHQRVWSQRFTDILGHFDNVCVSSELGKRKPEPEAFHAVASSMGVPLSRILFFDDVLENVEGARATGMQAVQVRSIADVEDALAGIAA